MDTDELDSTEIPDSVDDGMDGDFSMEDEEAPVAGDEQFSIRDSLVRLAETCLSHAHAKEQASDVATPSKAATASAAVAATAVGGDESKMEEEDVDANPLVVRKKSFPRITAALENAREMLKTMKDKQYIIDVLLQCVEGIAVKSSLYAGLMYLMMDDVELISLLVKNIKNSMQSCLNEGRFRALKLQCRFIVELAKARVLGRDSVMTLLAALDKLRAVDFIRDDVTYIICMTVLWASSLLRNDELLSVCTGMLGFKVDDVSRGNVPDNALNDALETLRVLFKHNNWKKVGKNSSYFVLHPHTALAEKGKEVKPSDLGTLELTAPESLAFCFEHSCHSCVVPQQVCGFSGQRTPFTAFDRTVYTDCINDVVAEFLDNQALCIKYLTSFIPVHEQYHNAFNAHLVSTLFALLVSPASPLNAADTRLLGDMLKKMLHTPSTPFPALIVESRDYLVKNIDKVDPRGIVKFANWIATELDASKWQGLNWNEMIVPLISKDDKITSPQMLFVDTLFRRCYALDPSLSFASKPEFPAAIKESVISRVRVTRNVWPEHLEKEATSQKLLSRLVTLSSVTDLEAFLKDVEKESGLAHEEFIRRFADCVVKVCSMSYLHCVGLLNTQYENIATIGSEVLLKSLWQCCGLNKTTLFLVLDKMTTAGVISFNDVVDILIVRNTKTPMETDDDDDDMEGKEVDTVRTCSVPWEAIDVVMDKCAYIRSTESLTVVRNAVSASREYAERVRSVCPFYADVAVSYSIHWQQIIA